MSVCRIFVSSPDDVALERTLVAGVVERLKGVFGHRSQISLLLWEQVPLDANQSFQPQLPDPSDVELFLLILWRRVGTPLPDEALPEGFEGPLTGTEYEFLAALQSQEKSAKPAILVYRKTDPYAKPGNEIDGFFQRYFEDDQHRLQKAFHGFSSSSEFESMLEGHLHLWFDKHLPKVSDAELASARHWYRGNPFRGLKAFRFDQAQVYRGRGAAIAEGIEKLKAKAALKEPFLLIMGMSGSGKSSLMRAGILPMLYTPQIVPKVSQFFRGVMRPADVEGDPVMGLVSALSADSANRLIDPQQMQVMSKLCKDDPAQFIKQLGDKLADNPVDSQLVLAIDQLEELYTSELISTAQQQDFSALVGRLVEELGIWVIATMRSDCYHLLGDTPAFMRLKQNGGQLDLLPPELYNIRQMITEPAKLARLSFEAGKGGQPPLDEVIAESAAKSPEGLPLLEFTLSQLYEARSGSGMLTFDCYRRLGGIEGAIASHAEAVYKKLPKPVKKQFSRVFNQLVNSNANNRFTRKWASRKELGFIRHADKLVDRFLEARLLVSERNPEGLEVVTLAHESLFRHWPRLAKWLENNRYLLEIRMQMSEQVVRWRRAKNDSALLLNAGRPLDDGIALISSNLSLDPQIEKYVKASVRRAKRSRFIRIAAVMALCVLTIYALSASYSAFQSKEVAERSLEKSQDLIEFLIGDLHTQLEKLGRLDVMQSIGEKALNYFADMQKGEATSSNLMNRSKSLYQIGSVYIEINQYEKAIQAFEQSYQLIQQLVAKNPENFNYVFELSQAAYWLGYAYWSAGDFDVAEQQFLTYLDTAQKLLVLKPQDPVALMEMAYSHSNMGTLASDRGETQEAIDQFLQSIIYSQRVLQAEPQNLDASATLADAYSWLGTTYFKNVNLSRALDYYQRELGIFEQLSMLSNDYHTRFDLVLAKSRIATMQMYLGNLTLAINGFKQQLNEITELVSHDPSNRDWRYMQAKLLSSLGQAKALIGLTDKAEELFIQSYVVDSSPPEKGKVYWSEEYYQRHYWYWRVLINQEKLQAAKQLEQELMAADEPTAYIWQIQLSNYQKQAIDLPRFEIQQIKSPEHLLAHIQHAILVNDMQKLTLLNSIIPEDFWLYPDMQLLKESFQHLLQTAFTKPSAVRSHHAKQP